MQPTTGCSWGSRNFKGALTAFEEPPARSPPQAPASIKATAEFTGNKITIAEGSTTARKLQKLIIMHALPAFLSFLLLLTRPAAARWCKTPDSGLKSTDLESKGGAQPEKVELTLINLFESELQMFWVDYDGVEVEMGVLGVGETKPTLTYPGHAWRLRKDGQVVGERVVQPDGGWRCASASE